VINFYAIQSEIHNPYSLPDFFQKLKTTWLQAQNIGNKCLKHFYAFLERLRPKPNPGSFSKIPVFKPDQVFDRPLRKPDATARARCAIMAQNCAFGHIKDNLLGLNRFKIFAATSTLLQVGAMPGKIEQSHLK
jgi:hypothetical protein